jgi:hypothetical protein
VEAAGFEAYASPTISPEIQRIEDVGGMESGITDASLLFIVESWPRLNAAVRAAVMVTLRAALREGV